jgi:uncharacterized membrane protein/mono/diheme cytochrome c family protein
MDLIYFLGRFHVLALHLPIGIVIAAAALDALALRPRFRHLATAAPYLWALAAMSAILTVVLGYMHFTEGGFDGHAAAYHRFFGTSVAVVTTGIWLLRSRWPQRFKPVNVAASILVLVLITLTGHYGGNLTHGSSYLTKYAPEPLRSWAGVAPQRRVVTSLAMADPFGDIVQPIFAQRCVTCHSDEKHRGGLSLVTHASVMKGGDKGAVIVAGSPQTSDLFRRISLPADEKDAMPAEGKTRLTEAQTAIIRWWIQSGATTGTPVNVARLSPEVQGLLTDALGLGSGDSNAASAAATPVAVPPAIVDTLVQAGFAVRQRSQPQAQLFVGWVASRAITDVELAKLSVASAQIVELDLHGAGVRDTSLTHLSKLTALTHLNLSRNGLTDAGLQQLKGLRNLEYLNLYGNRGVTAAGIAGFAQLPSLKQLYLWDTAVDAVQAQQLRAAHPDLQVDVGDQGEPADPKA